MFNSDWLPFSPLEREILLILLDRGSLTMRAISSALDRSSEGQLKDVLANLGARHVLVSGQEGYRINIPGDRVETFKAWLMSLTV